MTTTTRSAADLPSSEWRTMTGRQQLDALVAAHREWQRAGVWTAPLSDAYRRRLREVARRYGSTPARMHARVREESGEEA